MIKGLSHRFLVKGMRMAEAYHPADEGSVNEGNRVECYGTSIIGTIHNLLRMPHYMTSHPIRLYYRSSCRGMGKYSLYLNG
jgi:hypothetical protein